MLTDAKPLAIRRDWTLHQTPSKSIVVASNRLRTQDRGTSNRLRSSRCVLTAWDLEIFQFSAKRVATNCRFVVCVKLLRTGQNSLSRRPISSMSSRTLDTHPTRFRLGHSRIRNVQPASIFGCATRAKTMGLRLRAQVSTTAIVCHKTHSRCFF